MLDYYNLIMGTNDSCFVTTFNKLWKKEIISQNLPYTNAIQIENGNGVTQYIGEGVFSRVFTGFNTPSSIKKLLITFLEKADTANAE